MAAIAALDSGVVTPRGRVTLVGAGPGDADLLTVKAVRALQSADVILYDDLVSGEVLELARREAKRVCVGKRGHRESCRQDDINDLMVGLAGDGCHVVRLKSGDPTIFGRAGEEIAALADAGIAFHWWCRASQPRRAWPRRSGSHSRTATRPIRSATSPDTAVPARAAKSTDWHGLADPTTTVIVYMGGKTAVEMAQRLITCGRDADAPVAAVADVSRPGEWHWRGTLEDLARGELVAPSRAPMVIGIGRVFGTAAGQRRIEPRSPARTFETELCEVAG